MAPIRVLIADDHPIFRYGVSRLLASDPDLEVVGEAGHAAEVLTQVERLEPDVLLLDVRLPGASGIQVAQELRRRHPETPRILILSAYDEEDTLYQALRIGVQGYLLKNTSHQVLVEAIHQIHDGQRLLTAEQAGKVLRRFEELANRQAQASVGLAETELNILDLLGRGHTYAEIGDHLYLSESTIKRKVRNILDKMDVESRTHAVAEAIRRGLI